jgi:hypothetical protein
MNSRRTKKHATADVNGLRCFIEGKVLPWFEDRRKEIANRPLIREQAFGESLDPEKLERLGRYEVHLDRKLGRMLSMLIRLRDLRRARSQADPFGKIERSRCISANEGRSPGKSVILAHLTDVAKGEGFRTAALSFGRRAGSGPGVRKPPNEETAGRFGCCYSGAPMGI